MDERHVSFGCIGDSVVEVEDQKETKNPTHKMLGEYIKEAISLREASNGACGDVTTKFKLPSAGVAVTVNIEFLHEWEEGMST